MNNESGFNSIKNLSNIYNSTINLTKTDTMARKSKPSKYLKKISKQLNSIEENTRRPEPVTSMYTFHVSGKKNKFKGFHADIIQPISLNLNSTELSDLEKELIRQLLQDLKNPSSTESEKKTKIKSFFSEISKGTISGTLGTILSELVLNLPQVLIP